MAYHSYFFWTRNKNADIPILAAGTHACAYKWISGELNVVEDGELANDENSEGHC